MLVTFAQGRCTSTRWYGSRGAGAVNAARRQVAAGASSAMRAVGDVDVRRVEVVAHVVAAGARRGDRGGPRAEERVEHDVADVGVEPDEAARAARPGTAPGACTRRALSGRISHTSSVDARNSSLVIVDSCGSPTVWRASSGRGARSNRPFDAIDDTLGEVAQHRVRRLHVRAERARPRRALRLHPDDLAAQQQRELVLQDRGDVARERPVRLAAEVGDVHRDAPAGLEHPHAFGEDVAQHREVLEVASPGCRLRRGRARTPCPRSTAVTSRPARPSCRRPACMSRASPQIRSSRPRAHGLTVSSSRDLRRREPRVEVAGVVALAVARAEGPGPCRHRRTVPERSAGGRTASGGGATRAGRRPRRRHAPRPPRSRRRVSRRRRHRRRHRSPRAPGSAGCRRRHRRDGARRRRGRRPSSTTPAAPSFRRRPLAPSAAGSLGRRVRSPCATGRRGRWPAAAALPLAGGRRRRRVTGAATGAAAAAATCGDGGGSVGGGAQPTHRAEARRTPGAAPVPYRQPSTDAVAHRASRTRTAASTSSPSAAGAARKYAQY